MKKLEVEPCYTSCACNRTPFSADWGRNGRICYAYCNAVAIYSCGEDVSGYGKGIICTLYGHLGRVNAVKWIKNSDKYETELISGSVDGTVVLWESAENKAEYKSVCILKGHEGSVTCVAGQYLSTNSINRETLVLSASIDSTVRLWRGVGSEISQIQVIDYKSGFALSVTACLIPGSNVPILATGCDDHKIHLYAEGKNNQFSEVIALPGHEDWIRDVQFAVDDGGDLLLASCSQDQLIRVWRLSEREHVDTSLISSMAELPPEQEIAVKETIFSFLISDKMTNFAVALESVLCGHENWVYSVRWHPPQYSENGKCKQIMKLLSASMDKTMILWSPDKESGVWVEEVRVGDVGGNSLGFFGGLFSPCGQSILAHGYQGAFNQWTVDKKSECWEPSVTCGGHYAAVQDLAWSPDGGDFLVSVSTDQTSRLHAPWLRKDKKSSWHEISRPQIHGYDLKCLAMLGKYSFASGADEKLIRIFSAPRNFISNFCQMCGHSKEKEFANEECSQLPEGANVPALGLSNKAVFTERGDVPQQEEPQKMGLYPELSFTSVELFAPPSEDQLLQNTLWPEVGKLYGHGFEIFSLAAHPRGNILASACKAAKMDSANILLWDTESKRQVASLAGCSLTVTQMAFSNNGNYLLAVSRDRTWALFQRTDSEQYTLKASVDKKTSAHSRIIWSCCWSLDDKYFFTASRDKKVMAWSMDSIISQTDGCPPAPIMTQTLSDSVTAIASAPVTVMGDRYLLASGLDSGHVALHVWSPSSSSESWTTLSTLNQSEAHHLTVTRLAFRPQVGLTGDVQTDTNYLQLASSGADHAVRIYNILIPCS